MRIKIIKTLPNILTFFNMSMGLAAIYIVMKSPSAEMRRMCCILVFCGAVIDGIDGRVARRFQAVTGMGKQLDSFADLITFGVAPLAVLFTAMQNPSPFCFVLFLLFPMAGAFRLARYNLQESGEYFIGLPITAAGSVLAFLCLFHSYFPAGNLSRIFLGCLPLAVLTLSVLMVSPFRIKRIRARKKPNNTI